MRFLKKFKIILTAQWQNSFEYPGMLFIWMFQIFFLPMVMLFVWRTIISETPSLQAKENMLMNYYLLLPMISLFTSAWGGIFLAEKIRTGKLNMFLVKPITPFIFDIANNIAEKFVKVIFLFPMVLIGILLFPLTIQLTLKTFIIVVIGILPSAITNFILETIIGLLGFWMDEISAIDNFVDIAGFTLGGGVIPLFLFPTNIRSLANVLPFRYLAVFPLELLTGTLNQQEIIYGFFIQIFWIIMFLIITYTLWKKGVKKYSAFGG